MSTVGGQAFPVAGTHHLKQLAGQRAICPVSVNLPPASKTVMFQASLPDIIIDKLYPT